MYYILSFMSVFGVDERIANLDDKAFVFPGGKNIKPDSTSIIHSWSFLTRQMIP